MGGFANEVGRITIPLDDLCEVVNFLLKVVARVNDLLARHGDVSPRCLTTSLFTWVR